MSNTKLVVLEVMNLRNYIPDEFYFFQIRYGKQFLYPTRTVFILIGFGLALSFPNIVGQIIRCCKEKEMPNKLSLPMNILLHLAYANIAVIFINSELRPGFYVGIVFLALYLIFLICNIVKACNDKIEETIFHGFQFLLKRCKRLRSLDEAIKERRKLPPQITIGGSPCTNSNETPGKNENEKSEYQIIEYEYCTWEDNSETQYNIDSSIIECFFILDIKLDKGASKDIESHKKYFNDCYVNMICPGFREHEICFRRKGTNVLYMFLLFFWFILLITGYLDIFEIFICYKDDYKNITITKNVSNAIVYGACYNHNDEKLYSCKSCDEEEKINAGETKELENYNSLLD